MARRSSARLRGRNSSTPKRVSLSHDAQPQTPRTAPSKLAALNESDEMPGAFPSSVSPPPRAAQTVGKQSNVRASQNGTPTNTTPIKPAEEEMHPKQHQQSTARPLEEARWLGFSNMHPQAEPPKQGNKLANLQATPTKTPAAAGVGSPRVQFAFNREQSLELSPAAKRLMEETREEAAKIREQMIARGEAGADTMGRKIATPKSRKGRFSNAHQSEFSKMDSIASHHSVRHGQQQQQAQDGPLNISIATPGQKISQKGVFFPEGSSPTKSLKRKQSGVDLDEPDRYAPHNHAPAGGSAATPSGSQLPRPTSTNNLLSAIGPAAPSPSKRVRLVTGANTPNKHNQPPTTAGSKTGTPRQQQPQYPDLSKLASPTQAFLARTGSVKEVPSRIPAPALVSTPSKLASKVEKQAASPKPSTPLLARSPSKAAVFERRVVEDPQIKNKTTNSPLLLRSPIKAAVSNKPIVKDNSGTASPAKEIPLLARSPLKVSAIKTVEPTGDDDHMQESKPSTTPLLHRSPAKMPVAAVLTEENNGPTSSKSSENALFGRFQLLRGSPMKSILRSPQRLYSDDPAKVAAGTHLATPPKFATESKQTGTAQKHVDFTSSTKARYERAQSELSSTPSRTSSSRSPSQQAKSPKQSESTSVDYPALPGRDSVTLTPQKRRQTAVPGDFTFKAGHDSIVFSQSPNAPISASKARSATIRHVSDTVVLTSAAGTKRKLGENNSLEFNGPAESEQTEPDGASDKENEQDSGRPAKRLKKAAADELPAAPVSKPAAKSAPTKRPTLGVKPKGVKEKKPSVISKARLDALSQPKRRA